MTVRPRSDLVELLQAHSREIAADLSEQIVQLLTIARQLCDGDSDKVLLMAVIALRTNSHPLFRALGPAALCDVTGALPSFGINARSLAESTGIPRETVRRKVQELADVGWIVRKGNMIHYTAQGYADLGPARLALNRLNVVGHLVISALLEADETA